MPISYADIINGQVIVSAAEAAALVDAALESSARLGTPALPPSEYIWLDGGGAVDLQKRDDEALIGDPVSSAATLLAALLRLEDGGSPHRAVPGALLVALARVRGRID